MLTCGKRRLRQNIMERERNLRGRTGTNCLAIVKYANSLSRRFFGSLVLQAVCDLPTAAFIPDLFEAYPDSKVVIVERPVDKWYDSCRKTVQTVEGSRFAFVLQFLDPYLLGRFFPMMELMATGLFGPMGQPPKQKQESWCNTYIDIYKEARDVIPKDRLLEFKLEQGWEPLCHFLGDEIPQTPFPHINETTSFKAKMSCMKKRATFRILRSYAPGMLAVPAFAFAYYILYG